MLIWANFEELASKISFANRSNASFFAKGPETSYQTAVFVKIFDEIFSIVL